MDNQIGELTQNLSFGDKHRFLILLTATIGVALLLVSVGLALYNSSGAAQLDLSRPGYQAVSRQAINNDKDFENYATFGAMDQAAITEFKTLYEKQAAKAKAVDAFSGDPLDPDVLEISAPTPNQ